MGPLTNTPSNRPSVLQATYTAPTTSPTSQISPKPEQTYTFAHPLASSLSRSPSGTHNTAAKTAYLSELRGAVSVLQTEINEFLTARMEEDSNTNRRSATDGVDETKRERERKEEENYGEEVLDDED
ncbi:hypothetical protein PAAG_00059 [Paracoccidioides lutzii Pb01]|uniref:EKC/KEOPS complex subunit GON7 n=1 Tax=Paracoccidioides lutzii (strain ATCC MYA-826 / Pb01) TaxID=502779 RepID=C1GNG4_PARBA|nr:hypothetical protein PAAG_00059 [Paracoccidioides lutzii Pb01]EEH35736.1 hypothetical protein PAAG_00059 [Paracoccidioides lutzii Pb01]